jgi:uncharacterized protein YjiK
MRNIYRLFIIFAIFILSCLYAALCKGSGKDDNSIPIKKLVLISEIDLPFTEPSGIAWSDKLQSMWIVSGGDQRIYRLDTNRSVVQCLFYSGTDLEGIAFDETDSTLWLVDERKREIVHINLDGSLIMKKKLSYYSKKNKGPEGITIGSNHQIYVVNERDPSILIQLNGNYGINWSIKLNFALDYSDISYDITSDTFFIISDKNKAFYSWTLERGVVCKYPLPNEKNEGIAYDHCRNIFYIVNDETSKLYFYKGI